MTKENCIKKNCLTADEITRLLNTPNLNTAIGKRDKAILTLGLHTDLLRSEIMNLKCKDIDFKNQTISVTRTNKRKIKLNKITLDSIKLYLETGRPESVKQNLFLTTTGKKLQHELIKHFLFKYSRRSGMSFLISWEMIEISYLKKLEEK